jgi:hypothetical protein
LLDFIEWVEGAKEINSAVIRFGWTVQRATSNCELEEIRDRMEFEC